MVDKSAIKRILGELPLTAEVYWLMRQSGKPVRRNISLHKLEKHLPQLKSQALAALKEPRGQKTVNLRRILVFATLRYWIEHATLLSIALAGQGHTVTLGYLPYVNWRRPMNRFDLRRQDIYLHSILEQAEPLIQVLSFFDKNSTTELHPSLRHELAEVSLRDTQYTLQIEEINHLKEDPTVSRLHNLRIKRNEEAAAAVISWFYSMPTGQRPEVIIIPNGSILEMGAVYQAARYLNIPVVTYEFGEQRERIWFTQNGEVMQQDTTEMWQNRQTRPLNPQQWEQIQSLYTSRQNASLWKNFSRLWQEQPSQGGEQLRKTLQLDQRPVVLLAANVIGDSLTLGRQIFSQNMTDWLQKSTQYFAKRQDVQLIVRIHPGERYTTGPSVAQIVRQTLPEVPSHIRLVDALDPVNTYDLIELADLGLVYTTTVGMEMAMSGVPVVVAGRTHYRGKGFTLDPDSWEEYIALLDKKLSEQNQQPISRELVERAWQYAYYFFFEYPSPFPWHLKDAWKMLETWSMEKVLSADGQAIFGETFRSLAGEPRQWN
ncbi:MAG TPA: hypothetical protein VLM80_10245 [Anaerolineales bacterium]|nr:hypothetical protein [Anaerolineales bacterium]